MIQILDLEGGYMIQILDLEGGYMIQLKLRYP